MHDEEYGINKRTFYFFLNCCYCFLFLENFISMSEQHSITYVKSYVCDAYAQWLTARM